MNGFERIRLKQKTQGPIEAEVVSSDVELSNSLDESCNYLPDTDSPSSESVFDELACTPEAFERPLGTTFALRRNA
jgi:hypothetical protein